MNTKQLRQKILSLAIRGKLVPQDTDDEPASVLLERIRAEREKLIKEGKIKRDKKERNIFRGNDRLRHERVANKTAYIDEQIPFDVPSGWATFNLGDLFCIVGGGTPSTNEASYWGEGTPWFSSADIDGNGKIVTRRCVTNLGIKNSTTNVVPMGSIVVVTRVGLGKVAMLTKDMCFSQDTQALILFYEGVLFNRFVFYFLFFIMQSLKHSGRGTTILGITKKQLTDICFPVPPLPEQHRIVAAIESAFTAIDEIESNKAELKDAIARTKSKILSLAIRGKLVPQDPNDEPASALLERIRVEKEKLIKEGKIKRNKGVSAIFSGGDTSYYASLPKSWAWARICEVCEHQETKHPTGDTFRYIDIDSINNKLHRITEPKTMPTRQAPSRAAKGVRAGDTLFSMVRPYLENIAFVTDDLGDCIASTGFYVCRPYQEIMFPRYLYYFLTSRHAIDGINAYMRGDNSPAIRKDEMDRFLVPIPPPTEQQRIVTAIETTFEQLDKISGSLS